MADLHVALVHYPVYDKHGDVVTSAVTPIDVPDIARSCKTFGVAGFYVVTPVDPLRALVRRILNHWDDGYGREYNPNRSEAMEVVRLEASLEGVEIDLERRYGCLPRLFATTARTTPGARTFEEMHRLLAEEGPPWLMLLGTGWGLTSGVLNRCEAVLEPIAGTGDYNHLSVRAAAAILLDRLRRPIP